jgi:hypothetical protein
MNRESEALNSFEAAEVLNYDLFRHFVMMAV